ncbi:MAG: transglycosylase domain-containing protein, partial [Candidatus Promineifilaceae bacterium]
MTLFLLIFAAACATTTAVAGGIGGTVAVFNYFTSDLPDFTELEKIGQDTETTFETTKIYAWGDDEDNDGERDLVLIYEIIDPLGGDRQWVPLNQIPQHVIDATISIEDKTFWTNSGFDIEGIGRAFYQYVIAGGAVQGGSSITQQVVKNNLIDEERRVVGSDVDLDDYRRKIEEVVVSGRISSVYTKEQILEWYLNTNFYGNLSYGIEAAARVYFDKTASQLTLAESAILAAVPQSPAFNPIDNPEQAKARQELVLHQMFREGYIDRETLIEAQAADVSTKSSIEERFDIISPHFAFYVRQELEDKFGRTSVARGGLRVYTSLDLKWQEQAECVARAQVARLSGQTTNLLPADEQERCEALRFLAPQRPSDIGVDRDVNNASIVMLDPRTAEIKAMVGSLNYWDSTIDGSFNVAVDGLRQPGSSFKPFTFLTALTQGYTAASMMLDVETDFGTPYNGIAYVPQNYDRRFNGPMRMREALANSYNVPAVEAMAWVGVDKVVRLAHRMGITTLEDANDYGLPLTLGGGEVKLIDMVYAFSVFANRGRMIGQSVSAENQRFGFRTLDPVSILRVEDRNGNPIYEYSQPETAQIVSPQVAFIINNMMSDELARCPAFGCPNALQLSDARPVAAKTGTTNEWRDAWTIGFTPQLVTGVWIGNTNNTKMNDVPGSKGAAPVWNALMTWALQGEPKIDWVAPPGVIERQVCELNGLLPSPDCPTVSEYFVEGTEPSIIDNMYQRFKINRATGQLATAATPAEQVFEKVYVVYPDNAADWVRENNIARPPTQFDVVSGGNFAVGNAGILNPQPF